ncbi:helix-turn-helix domain-containing protein [Streptomyces albidoflavus]|uniref:helix-turn-helix domain-containing protein n=1 Tax=Streptomyces albidoflavus TaxID=1886 RepID=UPI00342608EC
MRIRSKVLRKLRQDCGMTQDQLASALGCSRSAVSVWETTGRLPRPDRLRLLANTLGVSVADLIETTESISLVSLRLTAGMLAKDVAHALKVSQSTYCHVERGRQRVPSRWFPILSQAFEVPEELLAPLREKTPTTDANRGAKQIFTPPCTSPSSLLSAAPSNGVDCSPGPAVQNHAAGAGVTPQGDHAPYS